MRRQNHTLEETLVLMDSKRLDVNRMPTHRFSFAQTKEAFDLVSEYRDGVMKAMIDFLSVIFLKNEETVCICKQFLRFLIICSLVRTIYFTTIITSDSLSLITILLPANMGYE